MGLDWEHNIKLFKFVNSDSEEKINETIEEWKKTKKTAVILETRTTSSAKYLYIIVHYKI